MANAVLLAIMVTSVMADSASQVTSEAILVEVERLALTRTTGGLVFEAEPFAVQIGRGGTASTRSDTDLIVYDPFEGSTERAFDFNASLSDLRIGSGFAANPGDDGDIGLEDGLGRTTIQLDGAGGLLILGTGGQDGDLQVRDSGNRIMLNFTASNSLLNLGNAQDDGDLWVRNSANAVTINLDGQSGNITNRLGGNGLVKGWARIRSDGTVLSCFRCNVSAAETQLLAIGTYEVDFTPVGTGIRNRPRTATLDSHSTVIAEGEIILADRAGDTSSVFVRTTNSSGVNANRAFTLVIY